MNKSKILIGFALALCAFFVVFQFNDNQWMSSLSRAFIVPTITVLYFLNVKNRPLFFTLFLVLFSISELTILFSRYFPGDSEYYTGNILYITAYVFLIGEILKEVNISHLFNNFRIHLIVLTALNIYVVYVLLKIQDPYIMGPEFLLEFIYNVVTLSLLSIALLNYFCKDDRKSLLLFLGALCIVFSEVIQIAYFYIDEQNLLSLAYSILLVLAFCFFYFQSTLKNEEKKEKFIG